MHTIKLSPKGLRWFREGHLWIYRDDFASGADSKANGEIVRVESSAGTFLAHAFYSHKSSISLRIINFDEIPPHREFFKSLISRARDRRGAMYWPKSACRLVSAEGDLFPGLIVDHYAGHLVAQILIPGVEKHKALIAEILDELFSPSSITLRCDLSVRDLEGLPQMKEMLKGEPQRAVEVEEGPVKYIADLWEGQKTGVYLDQQTNRIALAEWARGRALDAFCYQGHFSLHIASHCDEVIAVDSSAPALDQLKANCELNHITNVVPHKANIFEDLAERQARDEEFDLIVLDPPPFAKSRRDLDRARKGYREINRRALGLLKPGGRLATYSCSYNFSTENFLDMLRAAAADARRKVRVAAHHTQSPDHVHLLTVPETFYLKGFVLEALD